MSAVAIKNLKTSFSSFAIDHPSFPRKEFVSRSWICIYEYCLELMRAGILDKDARNSMGKCFGSVMVSAYDDHVSVFLSQWMALGPYSLFECLYDVRTTPGRVMFWEAFQRALLCDTGNFDFLMDCLKRFQNENGQECVPQDVWMKVEEAARWSPLRRAWMQAAARHE